MKPQIDRSQNARWIDIDARRYNEHYTLCALLARMGWSDVRHSENRQKVWSLTHAPGAS
jgi:hypothetical protein